MYRVQNPVSQRRHLSKYINSVVFIEICLLEGLKVHSIKLTFTMYLINIIRDYVGMILMLA